MKASEVRGLLIVALAVLAAPFAAAGDAPAAGEGSAWIALHVQVGEEQDEYFGQIAVADLERLRGSADGSPTFVLVHRVCSFDDDGHVEDYADDDRGGDVWFRVDDIRRIVPLKRDPHAGDRPEHSGQRDERSDGNAPLPKF